MPIYEYKCNQCKDDFELIVRSDTRIACESCGSENVKKKLSAFAIGTAQTGQPACAPACGGGFNAGKCGTGCSGSN